MRFLVTGGAGFIGSHLVHRLLTDGHEVVVLDDFSTGRRENLAPFGEQITLIEGSVTDAGTCAQAARGVDHVLHQAALGSVSRSVADPSASHAANLTGTLNLLVAARDAGVRRFVYASSSSVYGDTPELPKGEDMPPRPRSPYAVSKLGGELYCAAFHVTYGLQTVSLRYFNVFGPRQPPDAAYAAVIPCFLQAAFRGEPATIQGDGEQTRDFTYIDNVVQANMLAVSAPEEALGETFNIGCGDRVSINELWRQVRALVGTDVDAVHGPSRPGDVRDSLASLGKAKRLLEYVPMVGFQDGLGRTVEAFRAGS